MIGEQNQLKFKVYKTLFVTPASVFNFILGTILGMMINRIINYSLFANEDNLMYILFFLIVFYLILFYILNGLVYAVTVKIDNNTLIFIDSHFNLSTCLLRTEKYIVLGSHKKSKPALYLEIWFDKKLIVVKENIPDFVYNNLEVYHSTNLICSYRTINPGTIDKIEAFINGFNARNGNDNL